MNRLNTTRHRKVQNCSRSRGIAMMLVIITMGMVTVLAMSYLNSQATVTGIAENVRKSSEARAIAETGLDLAVEFIRGTPDWRDKLISGVWLENTAFANGVFQVTGVDPFDDDLADNITDMAMITAVGYVDGVTHTSRASVRPRDIRVAHWKLDDAAGPNVTDTIGGHNGTCIDSPTFLQSGTWGSAVRFDGSNDCVRVEHSSEFENKNGTVALWFKTTTVGVAQGLFSKDSCGNEDGHMMLWLEPGCIGVRIQRAGSSYAVQQGGILANQWYHVAATFGSQGVKLYLDGAQIGSNAFTGGMDGNTLPILLGATAFTNCTNNPQWHLNGWLDDVRVYSEQLTPAEIALLAQIPMPVPNVGYWALDEGAVGPASDSLGINDGNMTELVVPGQPGVYDNAIRIDGMPLPWEDDRNPRVEFTHDPAYELTDGTFSIWFKLNQIGVQQCLYSKDHDWNGPNGGHLCVWLKADDRIAFRLQDLSNSYLAESAPNVVAIDTWYHLVTTFGSNGMKIYLDGTEIANHAYTGGIQTNQEPMFIGANGWTLGFSYLQDYLNGYLDDYRIYDYQLSPEQIAAMYGGGVDDDPIFVRTTVKYEIE